MKRLALLTVGLSLVTSVAAAQDAGMVVCPPDSPQLLGVFPADTARDVTLDAPLRLVYTEGYFDPTGPGGDPTELIDVRRCPETGLSCDFPNACADGSGEPVAGRVQLLGDDIVFLPDGGWEANTTYAGEGLDQLSGLQFRFCTGDIVEDVTPPTFGQIAELTSDEVEPRCDAPEGGFRIGVFFEPANDDPSPPVSVEYLVYQTRGPGVDGPVVRARQRNFNTGGQIAMGFVLPPEDATSTICVRVAAVDGLGNVTFDELDGDEEARCVDPVQGNFFYGLCGVGAVGHPKGVALGIAFVGLVALMIVLRLRRRR